MAREIVEEFTVITDNSRRFKEHKGKSQARGRGKE
jgi:hypothetical protein